MKRILIAGLIAVGVFVVLVVALGTWWGVSTTPVDSSGLPIGMTAQQLADQAIGTGKIAVGSAVAGLAAGGFYWWRSGRPKSLGAG